MRVALLLSLCVASACTFTFDRELAPGEVRARVVSRTDKGPEPLAAVRGVLAGTRIATTTDSDGRLVLRGLPAGEFDLRLSKDELGLRVKLAITQSPVTGVDGVDLGTLVLERVGAIEGRVVRGGVPVAGALVAAPGLASGVTGADGTFRLARVVPGPYALSVAADGGEGPRIFEQVGVTVAAAETARAEIDLSTLVAREGGTVKGLVIPIGYDDRVGVKVWLEGKGERLPMGETGADGDWASPGPVAAGWYSLHAEATDGVHVSYAGLRVAGDVEAPTLWLIAAEVVDDDDFDGVVDDVDNCVHEENPEQENLDRDTLGDPCDDDVDGDGKANGVDKCPRVVNAGQEDLDGDGLGDVCDDDLDGDGRANGEDFALEKVSGDGQRAVMGGALADPLVVRVRDAWGAPVAGRVVTLEAAVGDTAGPPATSDGEGLASLRVTKVSATRGAHSALVATAGSEEVSFQFVASHGPAATLEVAVEPLARKATLPVTLSIVVRDALGNEVQDYAGTLRPTSVPAMHGLPDVTLTAANGGHASAELVFDAPGTYALQVADRADGRIAGTVAAVAISDAPRCGDGDIDAEVGETCDDLNAVRERCAYLLESCTVCDETCHEGPGIKAYCGDGIVDEPAEACDDGNDDDVDGCTNACAKARCGDGFLQPGEACDDGNNAAGDACNPQCFPVACEGVALFGTPVGEVRVTTTADSGAGSLRDALAAAPAGAKVAFDVRGTITLASELVVSRDVTLEGPGAGLLAIGSGLTTRLLRVAPGVTLYASGLTLKDGQSTCATGGCADARTARGACLYNEGTVVMSGVTFQGCKVADITNSGRVGGAVFNPAGATFVFADGKFLSNIADYRTGHAAIYSAGTATICRSQFVGNLVINSGGSGAIASVGTLVLVDSLLANNVQGNATAGGLLVQGGTALVRQTTFSGNNGAYGGGGVQVLAPGVATLERCTIAGNISSRAVGAGAGVGGPVTMSNSIVAGNTGSDGLPSDLFGVITSRGHNVVGAADGATGLGGTDQFGSKAAPLDAKLGALGDRGGRAAVRLPLATSPALDTGDATGAPAIEARGRTRQLGAGVDVGAAEVALPGLALNGSIVGGKLLLDVTVTPNGLGTVLAIDSRPDPEQAAIPLLPVRLGNGLAPKVHRVELPLKDGATPIVVHAKATNSDGAVELTRTFSDQGG